MTLREYVLRLKVFSLKQIDKYYDFAVQAMINRNSTATRKQGDSQIYIHRTPDDLYNRQEAENKLLGKDSLKSLRQIAKNLQEYRRKEGKDELFS